MVRVKRTFVYWEVLKTLFLSTTKRPDAFYSEICVTEVRFCTFNEKWFKVHSAHFIGTHETMIENIRILTSKLEAIFRHLAFSPFLYRDICVIQ